MGHIELAAPVFPYLVFQGNSIGMGLILDLSPRVLERVLYFVYIVLDAGDTSCIQAGTF